MENSISDIDIIIDGSIGGGSVLRVAAPLAISKGKNIRIINIRTNRPKPGLRNQHLLGLQLLTDVSGYILSNAVIGSTEVFITKNKENITGTPELQINTAASISLILQIAMNYALAAERDISFSFIGGGTYTEWSPSIDYCMMVQKPIFSLLGIDIDIEIEKHGFFPKGGAKGTISIKYTGYNKFNFTEGKIVKTHLLSVASEYLAKAKVSERQVAGFTNNIGIKTDHTIKYIRTDNPGSSLSAFIKYDNGLVKASTQNGRRGLKAEKIGKMVFDSYMRNKESIASVDDFMADQLIIALSLVPKGSSFTVQKISEHVKINIEVIKLTTNTEIYTEIYEDIFIIKN